MARTSLYLPKNRKRRAQEARRAVRDLAKNRAAARAGVGGPSLSIPNTAYLVRESLAAAGVEVRGERSELESSPTMTVTRDGGAAQRATDRLIDAIDEENLNRIRETGLMVIAGGSDDEPAGDDVAPNQKSGGGVGLGIGALIAAKLAGVF